MTMNLRGCLHKHWKLAPGGTLRNCLDCGAIFEGKDQPVARGPDVEVLRSIVIAIMHVVMALLRKANGENVGSTLADEATILEGQATNLRELHNARH